MKPPGAFKSYALLVASLVAIGLIASVSTAALIRRLGLSIPVWVETPGALSIAGVLYSLFHKYFWSWRIFRILGVTSYPDLRGRWLGSLNSATNEDSYSIEIAIEIRQTATDISVNLYSRQSKSHSLSADIDIDPDGVEVLRYAYINEPRSTAAEALHIHYGAARLRYYPDINQLRGDYFTSRERGTWGELSVSWDQSKTIGRFT